MKIAQKVRLATRSLTPLVLLVAALPGSGASAQSAGVVKFSMQAGTDFDHYTLRPSLGIRQWIRDHYYRMTVYTPYFDNRTFWYPRGDVYMNLYGVQRGSPLEQDHPEWILKDPQGNWLSVPWGCDAGSCPLWAADVSNPDYRAWWIDRARAILAHGYYGVWIDDVNMEFRVGDSNGNQTPPIDSGTGQVMTWEAWRRYIAEFMEQIRTGLPGVEIVHNSIWYAGPPGIRDSDPYIQREIAAADVINLERGIGSDDGLTGGSDIWSTRALLLFIDRVHRLGRAVNLMEFSTDTMGQEYALAGYFLISSGNDLTGDPISTPNNWWNGYKVDLGTPLGPYTYNDGVFRRDFTGGVVLLNEPDGRAQTIDLGSRYFDTNGLAITSVTLSGHGGAVLVKSPSVVAGQQ